MNETVVELSGSCKLVMQEWDTLPTCVALMFVEHPSKHRYSDNETLVFINKNQAHAIVELLTKYTNEENSK